MSCPITNILLQQTCKHGFAVGVHILLEYGVGANTILKTTDSRLAKMFGQYSPGVRGVLMAHGETICASRNNTLVFYDKQRADEGL